MPGEILFDQEKIYQGICRLADDITREYAGRELIIIGILDGCFLFVSDLVRRLLFPVQLGFISVKSYSGTQSNRAEISIDKNFHFDLGKKHILLLDTILDSGNTLFHTKQFFSSYNAESLKTCVLLDKTPNRRWPIAADFAGFAMDKDLFVVGYGLDYNGQYRNLAHICALG